MRTSSEPRAGRAGVSSAEARKLFADMVLIREVETRIAKLYPEEKMRCPTHLSIGQEAVAAGVCAALQRDDAVLLNHRCHAAYLAKGGDLHAMIAELYGKATGCAGGRGGSMHLVDPEAGVLGSSAILAGSVPIACGAAFAFARKPGSRVAAAFFGDAAVEEGTLFESLNLAALWKLPVLFVCENNGYSTCTPISKRQPPTPIFERARAFGMAAESVDGNDAPAVLAAAQRAVARARRGEGPTFLECATYRWLEHVGPNHDWDVGYRTREEVESWMARCPIARLETLLESRGWLPAEKRETVRKATARLVDAAFAFADKSPFPEAHGG
jgi:pyruvate dehydrogenase E1 component alpha subunit